ncbi:MAG: protease-like protein [Actinomycetia bacterium]|nr:protease-like protein [Actinomycetes bacterium]
MRRRAAALVVLAGLLLAGVVLVADPASSVGGTLDPAFGTTGATRVDFGGTGSFDAVEDIAVQSNGMLVAVGRTSAGGGIARLTADGALDATFGTGGMVSSATLNPARAVAIQSDSKLVVVGQGAPSGGSLVLTRYLGTGAVDTTFGTSGTVTIAMTGGSAGGEDVAVQSDGKIVVLAVDAGVLTVLRFSAVGVLDTTFGTGGRANQTLSSTGHDQLAIQSGGKLVVTGIASGAGAVLRLTTTGAADTTFGTAGVASSANHVLRALGLSSTGKVVAGGDLGSSDTKAMVSRRNADGTLDTTFATTGVASFAVATLTRPSVKALVVQADGSVVVTGRNDDSVRASPIFVAKLTPAGVLDTGFATGGIATFATVNTLGTASASGLVVDSSGRFVVGGSTLNDHGSFTNDNDFLVLRVLGVGTTTSTSTTAVTATAGGTVSSDPAGSDPTPTNKLIVSVTTPVAGTVSIAKTAGTTTAGYRNLAAATVSAPVASASSPLRMTFAIDVSTLPDSLPLRSLTVLRDATPATDCTNTTTAAPDPCIVSRTRSGDAVTIVVLTTHASSWTIARPVVQRLFGDDRILSSIAISKDGFAPGKADAVVLSRSDDFADALAAVPLAVVKKGPLLLTGRTALDDRVLTEMTRVLPAGKTVYILGGTNALSDEVVKRVERWGYDAQRIFGDTRYETAVAVATEGLGSPKVVIETTGLTFADALTAGSAAATIHAAVLLTAGATQSDATAGYLVPGVTRFAIGGPAAAADPDAVKIVGTDRYETAVLAAKQFFDAGVATIGAASGATFADALAGGVHAAMAQAPLILLPPKGALPTPVAIYLRDQPSPPSAYLYGGTSALGADVATALQTALGG